jgi:hypothetical protein
MTSNHLDVALHPQLLIEPIAIVGFVADEARRQRFEECRI